MSRSALAAVVGTLANHQTTKPLSLSLCLSVSLSPLAPLRGEGSGVRGSSEEKSFLNTRAT